MANPEKGGIPPGGYGPPPPSYDASMGAYPPTGQPQYPPPGQQYPPPAGQYPPPGQQYPPPGQQYPPPGQQAPPASGQQQTTVIVAQPTTVVLRQNMGELPCQMQCPNCNAQIQTATTYDSGTMTWVAAAILCFIGCDLGCCFIPFCVDSCKDVQHSCPNCQTHLGRYNRM